MTAKFLAFFVYHFSSKFRKRSLSNLALATDLHLSEKEIKRLAKASLQNLLITLLEYPKLAYIKDIHRIARCENPETANAIMAEGKGLIFFCGHQANWEILFLEGTSRMPGVAIGRPIKNKRLYDWIISIRQKYGGKIIAPQNAIREGLRALKKGSFLGIVGDQGRPDSGFRSNFLGRMAWSSPIAALLSLRTEVPIIVATTRREKGKYLIHYSDPIPPTGDVDLIMRKALFLLEESIKEKPEEWLWIHNRWKQQTPDRLNYKFRHESILIILPNDPELLPHLKTFREIYPYEFITLFVPHDLPATLADAEILNYTTLDETLIGDYRFKLVFNLANYPPARRHYLKLSAFTVISLDEIQKQAGQKLSEALKKICLKTVSTSTKS